MFVNQINASEKNVKIVLKYCKRVKQRVYLKELNNWEIQRGASMAEMYVQTLEPVTLMRA